jgi:DNA-directed RNA polymerase subunit RPC12/RpoP
VTGVALALKLQRHFKERTPENHMATIASLQCSAKCARCGTILLCPEWSESVGPQSVVNIWRCSICGKEFETTDKGVAATLSDAELVRAFYSSLLVA